MTRNLRQVLLLKIWYLGIGTRFKVWAAGAPFGFPLNPQNLG